MPVAAGRPHRYPFVPYRPARYPEAEMLRRGREFRSFLGGRRSVRSFSGQPVPRECIDLAIECANAAPSGAHLQPWKFPVIGGPQVRHRIRGGGRGGGAAELRGMAAAPGMAGGPGKAGNHEQGVPGRGAVDRGLLRAAPHPVPGRLPRRDAEVPDLRRKSLAEVTV
jgi:nitroreductase